MHTQIHTFLLKQQQYVNCSNLYQAAHCQAFQALRLLFMALDTNPYNWPFSQW